MDPRVISADWHDRQVVRPRTLEAAECGGYRGVAAEQNPEAAGFDGVAVVSAVSVAANARAPVVHLERADFDRPHSRPISPAQFPDAAIGAGAQEIGGLGRGHYRRAAASQT